MTTMAQQDRTRGQERPSDSLDGEALKRMLRLMQVIRRFEERAGQAYQQAKIGGFCHLYNGQEASAVGSIAALRPDDPLIAAYRDHGHGLGRGMDPKYAMAELFGKITGCAKGKGGSMHFFDKPHHMYGGHAIVGGQVPLGVGIAFGIQYRGEEKVCICYLGDGALNQGAFHESMNLAAIWNLPIIFALENNLYSMGTHIARGTSAADDLSKKAACYDMRYAECDGMDALDVYDTVKPEADRIRAGEGPVFINVMTYRYKGHSMSDPQKYRTKNEVNEYEDVDPIDRLSRTMVERGVISEDEVKAMDKDVKTEIREAMKWAEESEDTPMSELYTDVYSEPFGPYSVGEPPMMLRESEG